MKSTIIKLTFDSIKSSDQDLLELLKMFKNKGYFETEDILCTYVQDYVEERFDFISKPIVLQFATFLKDLGLWYWNTNLVQMMKNHFAKHYFKYNFEELCRLVKLIGYNHQKNDEFLSMIEDSLKIRIDAGPDQLGVTKESLKDLIEGISVGSVSRKRMNAQLRKLLKLQPHLFESDPKLTI